MEKNIEENVSPFAEGEGTKDNPFIISDVDGLIDISGNLSACYKLGTDVDLSGETFTPVGTGSQPFTGSFDGGGHAVRGLKVSSGGSAGLFGSASGASFKNLRIEGAEVKTTSDYAGILAGSMNGGSIERCTVSGTVEGKNYAGGLLGRAEGGVSIQGCRMEGSVSAIAENAGILVGYLNGGRIERCGASGSVEGAKYVGGLAGGIYNGAAISDSCALGRATSTTNDAYTGGLAGYSYSNDYRRQMTIRNCYAAVRVSSSGKGLVYGSSYTVVEDSYYDSQLAGFGTQDSYNLGKLTSAFTRKGFFKNWDFEEVWEIEEGESYPYLKWEGAGTEADLGEIQGGCGTEEAPYLIGTRGGFQCIPYERTGEYVMTSDIDLSGEGFAPVGVTFAGSFDGGGHAVRGLKVSSGGSAGLFGYASGAVFKNLRIEDAEVKTTSDYAGILAGYLNGGTVIRCSVSGSVEGTKYAGGLAGYVSGSNAKIQECCAEGTVTGNSYVGGLVGRLTGSVINSYALGSVTSKTSDTYTGGLVGYSQSATIRNCYAAAQVSSRAQGLVYVYSSTTIQNSFFDSDVAGVTIPTGQAKTTEQMFTQETYVDWDVENVWKYGDNTYPVLKMIELISQEAFKLEAYNLTWCSVIIKWSGMSDVVGSELFYGNETIQLSAPEIFIENLTPDTDYEFRVVAKIDEITQISSKTLKIRTRKIVTVEGLHCTDKGENSITLMWTQIDDVRKYEVIYNANVILTDTNTCTLTGLSLDTPYVIYVKALLNDGGEMTSNPIVEKIYELNPQTDYAREFISKCEEQRWFIDEIENLLNRKGKSINTLNSRNDFAAIYALCLIGRGISGQIPPAIGELYQLRYINLADNELSGQIPEEFMTLEQLIEQDLSGNHFTD